METEARVHEVDPTEYTITRVTLRMDIYPNKKLLSAMFWVKFQIPSHKWEFLFWELGNYKIANMTTLFG